MAEFTKEQLIAEVYYNLEHCFCSEKTKRLMEIALAALTAEPEEYIFDHPHGKLFRSISDKSNAGMPGVFPVYRLTLLEGLK